MLGIVGLGNPGQKFEQTRHNLGFMVIDKLCEQLGERWERPSAFFESEMATAKYGDEPVVLLKPGTFVNNSGLAVEKLLSDREIELDRLWVIHDDTELPFGTVRVKCGGTSGGHNGIKSIDQTIGEGYWRIKVGVGRPANRQHDLAAYVLQNFSLDELKELPLVIDQVTGYLLKSIEEGNLNPNTFNAKEKRHNQPN